MLRLIVISGRQAGKTLPLTNGRLLVGRGEDCGARLSSPEVSRKHCVFAEEDGRLVVEDLRSRNGTLVNGERISLRTTLKEGDRITVCSLEILASEQDPNGIYMPEWIGNGETVPQPTPSPTPEPTQVPEDVRDSKLHPGRLPRRPCDSSMEAANEALKKFFGHG